MYRVSQQVLDRNFNKKLTIKVENGEKFVKVCLHLCLAVQISLQFDEFCDQKISKF